MCGRFALHIPRGQIRRVPGNDVGVEDWVNEDEFEPRYNIAPHTNAPVIHRIRGGALGNHDQQAGSSSTMPRTVMQTMNWGLVPSWTKGSVNVNQLNTTNARSENLIEGGGMWGSIKGKKRCIIPISGYYEWLTKGKTKIPHYMKHHDSGDGSSNLMLLAGLYDCYYPEGETGKPKYTFSIVTTSANPSLSWLHERMPVILRSREEIDIWLDTSSQTWTEELSTLLKQEYDAPISCYAVPTEVGKVGLQSASFVEPVTQRKDGIEAMFSKQKAKQKEDASNPDVISPKVKESESSQEFSLLALVSPSKRKQETPEPETLDSSSVPVTPPKKKPKKEFSSPSKAKSPSKKAKDLEKAAANTAKITSFFGKS
ncbi:DUF159-domain-containing protein [Flagelloscypha sp. PMI_526]|nr:DUF159-domain-containing protein [Flagelloscypha sp. PMI_526]